MRRRKLLRVASLLAGVLVALSGPAASGQGKSVPLDKLAEALREGEPAFTAWELDWWVRQLTPLVEQAAGRRFQKPPVVKMADRRAVAAALARDLFPQLKNLSPGQSQQAVRAAARQQAGIFAVCLLGKYGVKDKVLYMLPRNFAPLLKLTNTDPKHTTSIVKLILAHELTHCLQDQQIGLGKRLFALRDLEAMMAFNATIEGHAVFVQDLVGRRLRLDDAVLEMARLLSAAAVKFEDPALEIVNKIVATQFEQIYITGRKFIAYHHKTGGMERVWHILANPPAETTMIARPQTYSAKPKRRLDYAKILAGLEKDFGRRDWTVKNLRIGHMLLRSVYANVEPKARADLLANVAGAQSLIAQCASPASMGDVTLFLLKDARFAPKMVAILEATTRKNVEKMKASAMVRISGFQIGRFAAAPPDATAASKVSFTVTAGGITAQKHVFVRIARGEVLVELHEFNVGLTDEEIAAIAGKIFSRYAKAKAPPPASSRPSPPRPRAHRRSAPPSVAAGPAYRQAGLARVADRPAPRPRREPARRTGNRRN